jgi:thymidylate kinase
MTLKFAFLGTHGTGKTTAAYALATELKKRGYDVDIITEAARSHPAHLPINEKTTTQSQKWIFAEMLRRELESNAQISICDRTLLDVFAYTYRVDNAVGMSMLPFIKEHLKTYAIIFYMEPQKGYLRKDGVRSVDKQFQKDIKGIIDMMMVGMEREFSHATTTEDRLAEVLDAIKESDINMP